MICITATMDELKDQFFSVMITHILFSTMVRLLSVIDVDFSYFADGYIADSYIADSYFNF